MICSKCGVDNAPDARFCKGCGQSLAGTTPPTDKTAPDLGSPVSMAGKRVAAICVWVVAAFCALVAFIGMQPTPALKACIAGGGSGGGCPGPGIGEYIAVAATLLLAGLGWKLWNDRPR